MAKVVCKGTVLSQDLSGVYTAVAQIISIEVSGSESETFDATTLDSGVWKEYAATGYSEPGEVSGELFYDPALSGHQSMTDLMATPADEGWRITYADSGATTQSFTGAGFGFSVTVAMDDGLKGNFNIKVDGSPGWPT